MSLKETMIDGTVRDKVQIAIDRLKAFEPPDGYCLSFSGGKDSVCIKKLADLAGVKYDAHYYVTSVDPPELVRFIKTQYPDVSRDVPKDRDGNSITMWNLIPKMSMPPTRTVRYCCKWLKESNSPGRVTITGVRWAESVRRKNERHLVDIGGKSKGIVLNDDNDEARRMVEQCFRTKKTLVNPIIDWEDSDVWDFIHEYKIPYCELYDKGYTRLGCIGCPMNTNSAQELERYPKYKQAYIRAFDRMLELHPHLNWETGKAVMEWWLNDEKAEKPIEGQESFYEEGEND